MSATEDPRPGLVAPELAAELPGVSLWWVAAAARPGPVGEALARRLRLLSDRLRVPAERAALARLMHGASTARDRTEAACLLAVLETGVGVWALDAAAVAPSGPQLRLCGGALVVADAARVHAPVLGDPLPGSAPGPRTRSVVLFALGVPGVPEVHLHEALWQAQGALATADA